jgi:hypothetical protein
VKVVGLWGDVEAAKQEEVLLAGNSSVPKYVDLISEQKFGIDSQRWLVKRTFVQRQAVDNFTPIRK